MTAYPTEFRSFLSSRTENHRLTVAARVRVENRDPPMHESRQAPSDLLDSMPVQWRLCNRLLPVPSLNSCSARLHPLSTHQQDSGLGAPQLQHILIVCDLIVVNQIHKLKRIVLVTQKVYPALAMT